MSKNNLLKTLVTAGAGVLATGSFVYWRFVYGGPRLVPEHYDHVDHPSHLPPRNRDILADTSAQRSDTKV